MKREKKDDQEGDEPKAVFSFFSKNLYKTKAIDGSRARRR
jgi:hypothetical protein